MVDFNNREVIQEELRFRSPFQLAPYPTGTFPSPVIVGHSIIDSTRGVPSWFDGDNWEWPTFVDNDDVATSAEVVDNTTTETEVFRFKSDQGAFVQGRTFIIRVFGKYSTASSNDDFTYRVKVGEDGFDAQTGGTTVVDVTTVQENVTDGPWQCKTTLGVWAEGASGTLAAHSENAFNNTKNDDHVDPITIDTTTAEDFVGTIEWNNAKADNAATRGQSYLQQSA